MLSASSRDTPIPYSCKFFEPGRTYSDYLLQTYRLFVNYFDTGFPSSPYVTGDISPSIKEKILSSVTGIIMLRMFVTEKKKK